MIIACVEVGNYFYRAGFAKNWMCLPAILFHVSLYRTVCEELYEFQPFIGQKYLAAELKFFIKVAVPLC